MLQKEGIGPIEISLNIERLPNVQSFDEIFLVSFMFLVRGIVDKTNEITNNNVIPIRLQNIKLESSNSPNLTVMYKSKFD